MALQINGTTLDKLYINGSSMDKGYINGTEVFAQILPGITLGEYIIEDGTGIYAQMYGYRPDLGIGSLSPDTHLGFVVAGVTFNGPTKYTSACEAVCFFTNATDRTMSIIITLGPYSVVLPPYPQSSVGISLDFFNYAKANLGNNFPFPLS